MSDSPGGAVAAVKKAKTAYQFFQADVVKIVKEELAAKDASSANNMGAVMSEVSARWKRCTEEQRIPHVRKEEADRERYRKESMEADTQAELLQQQRRDLLVIQGGEDASHRGAKAKLNVERQQEEKRRMSRDQRRLEAVDPDVLLQQQQAKEAREAATEQRRELKLAEEQAVADRHKKLDKTACQKQSQRLEYLLQQSSIFAKLKIKGRNDNSSTQEDGNKGKAAAASASHHRAAPSRCSASNTKARGKSKNNNTDSFEEEDSQEEEGEEEQMVFLTKQPKCIKFGNLKPYQLESLNWMIHLAQKGLNGILADEMGLGKTLQSISILAYHYEFLNIQGPHLICVPKSTLSNWMAELHRWCPALRAIRFHGSKEERQDMVDRHFTNAAAAHDGKRPGKSKPSGDPDADPVDDNSETPREWDVCVTTYEVCNTEKKSLQKFAWKYLVIDEAHRLKNETSLFSQTVRSFNTAHRLLLTGTPLQNNLHELWALLNFLLPDIFSDAEQFDEWFNLQIDDEEAKKEMISQLHKILRPFMLRRLKADVAKGLPPKTETLLMVGMSKVQKQLYKKLLLRDIDSITGNTSGKNKTAILNIVMQLRKCCGHPYLFEGVEDRTLDPLGEHLVFNCGKLAVVDKLLKKLKERDSRVLIFTQMTRILDILEDYMVMRGFKYCRLDGNTDYDTRESMIEEFNRKGSEKFCFILSTRAGGLGINLQTADTCILYDSDWNPQADLQAQDRCHRIGQKKPVSIYRMVTENTIEEKIVERAQQKLKLDAMVVQSGRLKDKDKLSKEDIMAAVRFGADQVFRSDESTITDEDIDAILERGRAKTKELSEKLQKAEKGDLLDFRLDGGISAQTFEGIDYSDKHLRDQLRLLAADSIGKRERKPLANYNPILAPKKSMVVNNRKIKLPKSLRLPRMEDHMFFNRERLLDLADLEFQTYAALREMGQLPPKEYIEKAKTLLPPELAQEKLDLLSEGFGHWTRSQYFHFAKAMAKFGREDIISISADMDLPVELVSAYSDAFWQYGSTELKKEEWERVKASVEKGEQKIAKRKKQSSLLEKFVDTFKKPRQEMTFANKGTAPFTLEQDRALLCALNVAGYSNWEGVREEIIKDPALYFCHTVQSMNIDLIAKRCDYRIRQMEKEVEHREKKLRSEKPLSVVAAERAVAAIKEMDSWETSGLLLQLRGIPPKSFSAMSEEAEEVMAERQKEKQQIVDRIREIEVQVRGCVELAEETRRGILRGDQYVNYSNITLKAGGPHTMNEDGTGGGVDVEKGVLVEARINPLIMQIPTCNNCKSCLEPSITSKLCVKRMRARVRLVKEALVDPTLNDRANAKRKLAVIEGTKEKDGVTKLPYTGKKKGPKPKLSIETDSLKESNKLIGKKLPVAGGRGNPLGNKRMSVPEELVPDLCRRIGAQGTNKRMKVITDFARDHPSTSVRQVTFKFSEVVSRVLPECAPAPEKRFGRAVSFFLRPRFYHYLLAQERPKNWEKYAKEDELAWKEECQALAKIKKNKEGKIKELMEGSTRSQQDEESESMEVSSQISFGAANEDEEETEEEEEEEDGDDDEEEEEETPIKKKNGGYGDDDGDGNEEEE